MLRKLLHEHSVSTTALLANYWKDEARRKENWDNLCVEKGNRNTDLLKDDFMRLFVDDDVKMESSRLPQKMWLPLATRCRFFRQMISQEVKAGNVQQIILLGSGFDTLAVRKQKYSEEQRTVFFEVDQPQVLACKEKILAEYGIDKNATYIHMDYIKGDLLLQLHAAGVDIKKPTLILWEGNTFYQEKSDVIAILEKLSGAFEKLTLCFDFMHGEMSEKTAQLDAASGEQSLQTTLDNFNKSKSPFKTFFTPEEMETLCQAYSLQCITRKTAAQLAREYQVDNKPYYTAEPYSVAAFRKHG